MKEIKFRGKRVDNGEWVHGVPLITQMSGVYIIGTVMNGKSRKQGGLSISDKLWQCEVDPTTVGQFVGLHDKNDKEIYEGDIVKDEDKQTRRVVFSQGCFQMQRYGGLAPLRYFNLVNS